MAYAETVEKDQGRLEIRRYWQSGRLGWFADREKWEGLRSVGLVESVRQVGTEAPTVERRYRLSRLAVDAEKFARAVRGHWGVENSLHWCLDVQMAADQSRARTGQAAENLATLRRLALNLLKRDKTKKRGFTGIQVEWISICLSRVLSSVQPLPRIDKRLPRPNEHLPRYWLCDPQFVPRPL